ncbi:MAG: peroxiredoxin [Bacteroidia bacterium]|jgi:peroxiredoxin|uniref:redoxin domain-containing protein n=1 Tax=Candidatus Pollutiaquabacter sp. TaxID=3416354 RepID=UPI001A61C2AF|nr:peroxiredoxin [Bacteroidota bacterium]MBL7947739.1 peroxiredoxin [Bacteroidia bacterium]MBP6010484.1 peroxiredoxin [Bacteroidia bacterium]MBP7270640.1 peroxiredoxin [Bacteroidia bacterium]MBP7437615.1 peroxiredoxin [Bacteroidia bacterium]
MLQIGQKAPDFKLINTNKEEVTLANFKGKNLVVFFFPMAWTGVCTKEMCSIQEDYNAYSGMNAETIGVSVDSFFALKRFGEDNKITFPLLSDFNKIMIRDYDMILPDFAFGYKNVAKRATVVIDKEGIVRYIEVLPNPGEMPNMDAIKQAVQQLG